MTAASNERVIPSFNPKYVNFLIDHKTQSKCYKIFKIFSFWKWNRINNESFGLLRGGGRTLDVFIYLTNLNELNISWLRNFTAIYFHRKGRKRPNFGLSWKQVKLNWYCSLSFSLFHSFLLLLAVLAMLVHSNENAIKLKSIMTIATDSIYSKKRTTSYK